MRRCVVFQGFFASVVALLVCFVDDGGERFCEPGAELFVVSDVESGVERLVHEPAVGYLLVAACRACVERGIDLCGEFP